MQYTARIGDTYIQQRMWGSFINSKFVELFVTKCKSLWYLNGIILKIKSMKLIMLKEKTFYVMCSE
jgi:hypothetical protein